MSIIYPFLCAVKYSTNITEQHSYSMDHVMGERAAETLASGDSALQEGVGWSEGYNTSSVA